MLHYVVEKAAETPAQGSPLLVLLHGYGSNEQDLMGLAPAVDRRLILASAQAPQALEWGGYAWFPVEFGPAGVAFDFAQAHQSLEQVLSLVRALREEHATERVFLLGFSQGASMGVAAALREPSLFAGVASLSGMGAPEMLPQDPQAVKGLPVLVAHGRWDPVVPIAQGRALRELLSGLPLELTYGEYDMGHEINQECLEDLNRWLGERLA